MKTVLILLLLFLSGLASAQVHVKGYYRKNGTYVAPYVRSAPNNSRLDNYGTRGNYNPYTGAAGTRNPYPGYPTYQAPTYSADDYQAAADYYAQQAAESRARIAQMQAKARAQLEQMPEPSYGGNRCTDDCSGHEAGYEWAQENGITDPDDCAGNSESFVQGCQTFTDEEDTQDTQDEQ